MNRPTSQALFHEARDLLVGDVNSPVRAFKSVGGTPVFMREGSGSRMRDEDGNTYIDYVGSWGPHILGHSFPPVVNAIVEQAKLGTSFGTSGRNEAVLARLVRERVPSVEKVRFVNSGTEATMSAIRVARGVTGRPKILKFEGCYHGHGDAFLIAAGSGALTFGVPDSAGITEGVARDTLTAPYNDLDAVRAIARENAGQIAAVILEPVVGNMGVVRPAEGFLEGLRHLCDAEGILLIFDEVMTGFRVAAGGAQALFAVMPDITTMGKVIGGGMPVGAYGASARIMDHVSPLGPVYQAGTLSGNPVAMAAGIAMLTHLDQPIYDKLAHLGGRLEAGLVEASRAAGVPVCVNRVGSMLTVFFQAGPVVDLASAKKSDTARFGRWFHALLDAGVYWPPSQFEAAFISAAHSDEDVDQTVAVAAEAFRAVA
ncbi:MAG: glutamate-1-semialdehyde 2,1-aminomutase [Deltaproteobacteria bacterium]|nr:glutamate-1-semialdehyde 2,1-aminomutase [Deltaproteobacteria bacterium]